MNSSLVSVNSSLWVINEYTNESKRHERIELLRQWPELHEALEALSTGFVSIRSSKVD